jgi:hypothetical protein
VCSVALATTRSVGSARQVLDGAELGEAVRQAAHDVLSQLTHQENNP